MASAATKDKEMPDRMHILIFIQSIKDTAYRVKIPPAISQLNTSIESVRRQTSSKGLKAIITTHPIAR